MGNVQAGGPLGGLSVCLQRLLPRPGTHLQWGNSGPVSQLSRGQNLDLASPLPFPRAKHLWRLLIEREQGSTPNSTGGQTLPSAREEVEMLTATLLGSHPLESGAASAWFAARTQHLSTDLMPRTSRASQGAGCRLIKDVGAPPSVESVRVQDAAPT